MLNIPLSRYWSLLIEETLWIVNVNKRITYPSVPQLPHRTLLYVNNSIPILLFCNTVALPKTLIQSADRLIK